MIPKSISEYFDDLTKVFQRRTKTITIRISDREKEMLDEISELEGKNPTNTSLLLFLSGLYATHSSIVQDDIFTNDLVDTNALYKPDTVNISPS